MNKRISKLLMLALGIVIGTLPPPALPDDIDLFVDAPTVTPNRPNILIVLDNTSNWSAANQHFEGDPTEGQGEVSAIKAAIAALGDNAENLNIGIMEFSTKQAPGGQITYAMRQMTASNRTALFNILTDAPYSIYNNINDPNYKLASNVQYGDLVRDAYNYFKGNAPVYPGAPPIQTTPSPGRFDPAGYTDSSYTKFKAPLSNSGCTRNYVIFIGNIGGGNDPITDTSANTAALGALGGSTTQHRTQLFASGALYTNLGFSQQCYASNANNNTAGANACSSTEPGAGFATQCASYSGFNNKGASCRCDVTSGTTSMPACATGTQRYSVFSTQSVSTDSNGPTTTTPTQTNVDTGTNLGCTSDTPTFSNPVVTTNQDTGVGQCTTDTLSSTSSTANTQDTSTALSGCQANAPNGTPTCPATTYSSSGSTTTVTSWASCGWQATSAVCLKGNGDVDTNKHNYGSFGTKTVSTYTTAPPAATCPANSVSGSQTTSWSNCTVSPTTLANCSATATPPKHGFETFGTKTVGTATSYTPNPPTATCPADSSSTVASGTNQKTTTTTHWANCTARQTAQSCGANQHNFELYGDKTVSSYVTTTTTSTTTTTLGNTAACSSSASGCSTSGFTAPSGGSLSCGAPSTTTGVCPNGGMTYQVQGISTGVTPTGGTGYIEGSTDPLNAYLWTDYLRQNNILDTFTIDVYHDQPNAAGSALLYAMAGRADQYYNATNTNAIKAALSKIFNKIQSVNSTFASAALPVNATNRAQNQNQVFIGMFRPDPNALPRWYGNLKRYQLIKTNTGIELGDSQGASAVNLQTGFIDSCAVSYWTNDSSDYWLHVPTDTVAKSQCTLTSTFSPWSDQPDGPLVEKGGAAEIQRQGNNPAATATNVIDSNRNMLTLSGSTLVPFNSANASSLSSSVVSFTQGMDVVTPPENNTAGRPANASRPSIHGDVVHSRPLPITYSSTSVVAYYGSNDGTFRAVRAEDGKELWSFIPPEFFSRLPRLMNNSPVVKFPRGSDPTATKKDYFFDGSVGVYQNANNSNIWIYPTMRRGGRMIYGFDVTTAASPSFKWRVGCPNLTDDIGCTTGMSGIGQTWSLPNVAFINGYSATTPVIIVGGGYDACEDDNSGTPACSSTKGNAVYVLDAGDGHVIASFPTTRGVAADVSLVDVNADGSVDYAYAADTGGNIYRINFVNSPTALVSQASNNWSIQRVAYTNGAKRKFLFGPAVLPAKGGRIYLALGSGDREHPLISEYPYPGALAAGDLGVVNRFYVYVDNLAVSTATNLDDISLMNDATNASCDPNTMIYPTSSKSGWFLNLNKYGPGEQTVTSAVIAAGLATFSTNRPTVPDLNACANLGEARGYLVSLFNGSGAIGVPGSCGGQISNTFVGGGLPPSPVLATVPISGVSHTVFIGAVQKDGSTSTIIQSQEIDPTISSKRKQVYWKKSGDN